MTAALVPLFLLLASGASSAQAPAPPPGADAGTLQRLFESGRYQEVVDAASPESAPEVQYLAARSYQRLQAVEQAVDVYARLAARPPDDAWHLIGLSGQRLLQGDPAGAEAAARDAVGLVAPREPPAPPAVPPPDAGVAPDVAAAHYQLGLALAMVMQWEGAAAAFDRAAEIQPDLAHAQYFGGLMHYRANRPDQMAVRFDRFLKLAPEAAERPEVQSIMQTLQRR